MAEALMRMRAEETAGQGGNFGASGSFEVAVKSAGVKPGDEVNSESAASLLKIGADMTAGQPTAIDPDIMATADRVIVVGGAEIPHYDGMKVDVERWVVDEPSARGIHGEERMDMLRDDIDQRVRALLKELTEQK